MNEDKTIKNLDIKNMLPEAILESLSDLHKSELQNQIEQIVEAKVQDKLDLAIKSSQVSYDAMMNERLVKVVEGMEANSLRSLEEVVSHLKERHANRVQKLKESYEKKLAEQAQKANVRYTKLKESTIKNIERNSANFRKNLTNLVVEYIENNVEKHLPLKTIKESVRNKSAMRLVENLKQWLNVDEVSSRKALKQPLREAVSIIGETESKSKKLAKENESLKAQLNESQEMMENIKRDAFLAEKLATVPSIEQRNYLKRVCEGASIEWIEQNFELSKKFFRQSINENRTQLAKQTIADKKPLQRTIKESAQLGRKRLGEAISKHNARKTRVVTRKNLNESIERPVAQVPSKQTQLQ